MNTFDQPIKTKKILTDTSEQHEAIAGESYLEFSVGIELYAVPLLMVKEVLPLSELTPIPKTPSFIKGMMNLRGHVITVADLATKLNFKISKDKVKNNVAMILQKESVQMGVIVDSVHQVLHLTDQDIAKSNGSDSKINMDFIKGIHQKKDCQTPTIIIDLEEVFEIDKIIAASNESNE